MTPYYEFYSDLDLIIRQLEELQIKCHYNWENDEPFKAGTREESPEIWDELDNAIQEVLDKLNDEPFFETEE